MPICFTLPVHCGLGSGATGSRSSLLLVLLEVLFLKAVLHSTTRCLSRSRSPCSRFLPPAA